VVGDDAGVVLEAGDANGLQNAVMGYLNNPSLIEQHGRCAAAKVQQYHWGRYFEEVQWVVDNTLVN
jgi:glycosyltransferase involved in cell wall biosynthesis